MISLIDIANSIQSRATAIKTQVLETEQPLAITAKKLASKVPDLAVLGDMPVIRCVAYKGVGTLEFAANPISIHLSDDDIPTLYDANLNPVECEIKSYKINPAINVGSAIVKIKNIELEVSLNLNQEFLADLDDDNVIVGECDLPAEFLNPYPQVLCSLASFEIDESIKILECVGNSREHNTPLYDVEYKGTRVRNVIGNSGLNRGFEKHGEGSIFSVSQIRKTKSGTKKIDVYFHDDVDFADLTI